MSDFRARVVLLGASNVTKGVSVIIETARMMLGSPLDVYCAIGHGRSYGARSFVLVRSLPSVLDSRLWQVLRDAPADVPTYAMIADVGNDVMYGAPPRRIAGWVDECARRLQAMNARIIMTSLPAQRIERLAPRQYAIARSLLFPANRLTLDQVRERVDETVRLLQTISSKRDVPLEELPAFWYGVDPIHIRYSLKPRAWMHLLRHWCDGDAPMRCAQGSLRRWIRLRTLSPERWWLLGMQRGRAQPAAVLGDGTRVSLY